MIFILLTRRVFPRLASEAAAVLADFQSGILLSGKLPPYRLLRPHALRAGSLDPLLQVVRHPLRVLVSLCRRDAALHLIL